MLLPLAALAAAAALGQAQEAPRWEVVSSSPEPVIGPADAAPHGVFQGFETGQYTKVDGTHFVAINELGLCEHVTWDRTTRAALWSAPNGSGPWTRVTTLRNTSSMHTLCNLTAGEGLPNACSWAPTLVFAPSTANGSKPGWHLFYSACEDVGGAPSPDPEAPKDKPGDGIVHAVSTTDSMTGPFIDLPSPLVAGSGVVMPFSHAFTTWQLPNGTRMSFRNNVPGAADFSVGLERAIADDGKTLGGPWAYDNNSVPFPCGPENPIVSRSTDKKWFFAVYDALEQVPAGSNNPLERSGCTSPPRRALCKSKTQCDKIAIAWSPDGVTWTANATTLIQVQTGGHPCGQIRTPLGLVEEPETCAGCYSVLWTGYSTSKGTDANGFTPVCHAVIKQVNERAALKTEDGEGEAADQPPIDQPPSPPKYCQQGENDRFQTTRWAACSHQWLWVLQTRLGTATGRRTRSSAARSTGSACTAARRSATTVGATMAGRAGLASSAHQPPSLVGPSSPAHEPSCVYPPRLALLDAEGTGTTFTGAPKHASGLSSEAP